VLSRKHGDLLGEIFSQEIFAGSGTCPNAIRGGAFLFPPTRHRGQVKLALRRSLIFWCGMVILTFICWAWRDSDSHLQTLRAGAWTVFHSKSALVVSFNPRVHHGLSMNREDLLVTHVVEELFPLPLIGRGKRLNAADFPPREKGPMTLRNNWLYYLRFQSPAEWVFLIPHWIMLAAFALPWFGLLVWRTRRKRRASPMLR
jgi:hypothetical protein